MSGNLSDGVRPAPATVLELPRVAQTKQPCPALQHRPRDRPCCATDVALDVRFPKPHHLPPRLLELRRYLLIASHTPLELCSPVVAVARSKSCFQGFDAVLDENATVPVVAIDEHRNSFGWKDKVWPSRKVASILSVPEPESMNASSKCRFCAILRGPNRRHVAAYFVVRLGPVFSPCFRRCHSASSTARHVAPRARGRRARLTHQTATRGESELTPGRTVQRMRRRCRFSAPPALASLPLAAEYVEQMYRRPPLRATTFIGSPSLPEARPGFSPHASV